MSIYEALINIKKPTLLVVDSVENFKYDSEARYRVLYPNGRCEYVLQSNITEGFHTSCFCFGTFKERGFLWWRKWVYSGDLKGTLDRMKSYDERTGLKITSKHEFKRFSVVGD